MTDFIFGLIVGFVLRGFIAKQLSSIAQDIAQRQSHLFSSIHEHLDQI